MNIFEIIGYLSSFLIILSYCFKGKKLRYASIVASTVAVIYALGLSLWPVLITNSAIIVVNLYQLYTDRPPKRQRKTSRRSSR